MILPLQPGVLGSSQRERVLGWVAGLVMLAGATLLLRCGAPEPLPASPSAETAGRVTLAVGQVQLGSTAGASSAAGSSPSPSSPSVAQSSSASVQPGNGEPHPRTRRRNAPMLPGLSDLPPYPAPGPVCEGPDCGPSPSPGDGSSGEGNAGAGGPDKRGAAAIEAYRNALAQWLAPHFEVRGTSLPAKQLLAHRVAAVLEVEPDGTLIGFEVTPSGDLRFDAAADHALRTVQGRLVPDPPPDYPGPLQATIRVTFRCRPQSCD